MARKTSTAADVRAFAVAAGLLPADRTEKRGRLSTEVIAAFNKANPKAKYAPASATPKEVKVEVTVQDKAGRNRKRTVAVPAAEVRAQARAAGFTVGERGRVPQEALVAVATARLGG